MCTKCNFKKMSSRFFVGGKSSSSIEVASGKDSCFLGHDGAGIILARSTYSKQNPGTYVTSVPTGTTFLQATQDFGRIRPQFC